MKPPWPPPLATSAPAVPYSGAHTAPEYEYDDYGRQTKVIEDENGLSLATTYDYNNQDEVTKTTTPMMRAIPPPTIPTRKVAPSPPTNCV